MRCTGKVGGYCAAKVPVAVDDAIASTALHVGTGKLSLPTVKSKMDPTFSGSKEFPGAEVLLEYHLHPGSGEAKVSTLETGVRRFQFVPENCTYDYSAKPGMVAFMDPVLDGGFVPDICKNNDQAFVNERSKRVKTPELMIGRTLENSSASSLTNLCR